MATHCPKAIAQAPLSYPLLQAGSCYLLPSCITPPANLPFTNTTALLSRGLGCNTRWCRCSPMHSSCAQLRKAWHGMRAACRQQFLGRESGCWPWVARCCARSLVGYIRYLMPNRPCSLFALLADSCFHAAITPAFLQAHFKHEHQLLVLGTQLAKGCANIT